MKPFDPGLFEPNSIDAAVLKIARRRQTRELLTMVISGVIVTVMVVTFYRILTG